MHRLCDCLRQLRESANRFGFRLHTRNDIRACPKFEQQILRLT